MSATTVLFHLNTSCTITLNTLTLVALHCRLSICFHLLSLTNTESETNPDDETSRLVLASSATMLDTVGTTAALLQLTSQQ